MSWAHRAVATVLAVLIGVPAWLFLAAPSALPAQNSAGTVYLSTVPSMPGVTLDVRGVWVTTGADGTAALSLGDINGVASSVTLASHSVPDGSTVAINRIVPAPHAPHESHLSVGLDVTSPVRLLLLQAQSHIPPSHVTQLNLHSVTGQRIVIDPRRTTRLRLQSRKIHFVHGVLQAQPVTWAVEGVQADPGISVTTAQPRFDPYGHRKWFVRLATVAGTVDILTVPRTPGVQFDVNGTSATSDPRGIAVAQVTDLNNVQKKLTLASSSAGVLQVSALRVNKIKSLRKHERRLIAAIDVRRPVNLRFVDAHDQPVAASSISEVTMSAGLGSQTKLIGTEVQAPALLLTRVADRAGSDWGSRKVSYSLSSVRIDGANAVFTGRQRFTPQNSSLWTVHLAVFSLTLTVRDALFGSRIGTRTVITRPNGSHAVMTVGASGPRVIPGMVRGLYMLRIDAAVLGGSTSVLVSRDGVVELRVITLLDTVVIGLAGALLLPAAVLIGIAINRRRNRGRTVEVE